MADSQKSVKVTIDVIVNQAKGAIADIQSATAKATASLEKMGKSGSAAAGGLGNSMQDTAAKSKGFFDTTTMGVLKGVAAYDLLRKGAGIAFDFLKSSVEESIEAARVMAQVRTNVENAGFAFSEIGPKLDEYSKKMIQLGFDDEDTAESMGKLIVATGDYGDALKLNQLAMDLSRAKNIGLGDATRLVTLAAQGNTKELKLLGIELDENASAADNLAKMQDKLKGSAVAFAETAGGKLAILNEQWANVKQQVGDELVPVMAQLLDMVASNQDVIVSFANALVKVAEAAMFAAKGLVGLYNTLKAGASWLGAQLTDGAVAGSWALNKLGVTSQQTTQNMLNLKQGFDETAKESWNAALKLFDNKTATEAVAVSAAKASVSFTGIGKAAKSSGDAIAEQKRQIQDLSKAVTDVTRKQEEFSFKSVADFARFTKVLLDTKTKQEDWVASAKQGFEAFSKLIDGVNSDIDQMNGKLRDTRKAFADFVISTTAEGGASFAQIVHDAEMAIPDLQKRIAESRSSGEDTADLEKELKAKNDIIAAAQKDQYQKNQAFVDELAFLRSQDGKNELDQAFAVMTRKIEMKTKEFETEANQIAEQIKNKERERDAYVLAQQTMTTVFQQNVLQRQKAGQIEMQSLYALASAVLQAAQAYNLLAASANSAANAAARAAAISGARANGGPVESGKTYLVGEKGPELFTPSVSGSITPNNKVSSASGVTINIINPSVRSDSDIRQIVIQTERAFSRRDELASMGAYK